MAFTPAPIDNASLLSFFAREGYGELPTMFDPQAARELYQRVHTLHPFDQSLFISEEAWESGPKSHHLTNPGPGTNALEKFPDAISFVRDDPSVNVLMTDLLGKNFKWLFGKFICRLPQDALPEWLSRKIAGKPANTLGAFIHPQFRDCTYLLNNDLHQDIQDWARMPAATREHRFITLYVYLNDVTSDEAPITLLPGTHCLGATPYQHNVTYNATTQGWVYKDYHGHSVSSHLKPLTGPAGYAGFWHPCLLHGSNIAPKNGHQRISLRYLLARSDDPAPCALDSINAAIHGKLYLEHDYTPGVHADKDGQWNLQISDYMKQGLDAS